MEDSPFGPPVDPEAMAKNRIFEINLERSRIYWDYYRSMFIIFSVALIGLMVCTTLIYTKGDISLAPAVGVLVLLFLCVILLAALMSLSIWRHENKHLDELIAIEREEIEPHPTGAPLV